MYFSNSVFFVYVVCTYFSFVAWVFEYLRSSVAVVCIDLGFVAIVFVEVVYVPGAPVSQWIRCCVRCVD